MRVMATTYSFFSFFSTRLVAIKVNEKAEGNIVDPVNKIKP